MRYPPMNETVLPWPQAFRNLLRSRSHASTLLRGTAGSCATSAVANGLLFLSQIVFARLLGVAEFGIYVLAIAWISVLLLVGRIGFDLATVKFVAAYHSAGQWGLLRGFLRTGRIVVLTGSTAVGLVFAGVIMLLKESLGDDLAHALWIGAAIVPALALVQIASATVRGLGHVVVGVLPVSIGLPLLLLLGFGAAVLWLGLPPTATTALAVYLVATIAALICLWPMIRHYMPAIVRRTGVVLRRSEWLRTASAMMLLAGFGVLLNQSTTVIVGMLGGATDAGLFGATSRIASIIQIVTFSLITALGPMASRLHTLGEHDRLQRAVDIGVRAVAAVAVGAAATIALLGERILALFGTEFVAGYDVMMVLVAGQLAGAMMAPAGILLNMTGHQNLSAAILACAAVLNAALCAVLIPAFGLIGAAIAVAATTAMWNAAMAAAAHYRLGIRTYVSLPLPAPKA